MPSFFEWEWSATTNFFFLLAGVDGWILCWLHVVCPGMFVGGWVGATVGGGEGKSSRK